MNVKEFFEIVGEDCPLYHENNSTMYFTEKGQTLFFLESTHGGSFVLEGKDNVKVTSGKHDNSKVIINDGMEDYEFVLGLPETHKIFKIAEWKEKITPGVTVFHSNSETGKSWVFKLSYSPDRKTYYFVNLTGAMDTVSYDSWDTLKRIVIENVLGDSDVIRVFCENTFAKILKEELESKRQPNFSL